jgi:protoporphyrin/coproporphyrin ferrochelatase
MSGGQPHCQAVVLIGFGGPTAGSEVRPFLDRVLAGRPVPPARYAEVLRHYEAVGRHSPYNEITMRLAIALRARLEQMGILTPVIAGFRFMQPFIGDVIQGLMQRGICRAFGFVLAAHRCEASWDRYLDEIRLARERLGDDAPEFEYPSPWHGEPAFIAAATERVRTALEHLETSGRRGAELIFTAHSIPLSMGGRAGYVEQLHESARLISQRLGRDNWTLAFQSRSGNPRDLWLEPDIKDVLRKLAGRQAVIVPLGFLCDNVEVLYDIDIEAARVAREAGVSMVRAATVGEHSAFVQMIANFASRHLANAAVSAS